jgi:hypothetical protein
MQFRNPRSHDAVVATIRSVRRPVHGQSEIHERPVRAAVNKRWRRPKNNHIRLSSDPSLLWWWFAQAAWSVAAEIARTILLDLTLHAAAVAHGWRWSLNNDEESANIGKLELAWSPGLLPQQSVTINPSVSKFKIMRRI